MEGKCRWKFAGRPRGLPLEVGGPPARIAIFQWAGQDRQDSQDPQEMASHAAALGHWLDRRHWDNGRLARCMDCQWPANATRKMRVVPVLPIPGAKHLSGTFLGVLGVLFVLAKALVPRSGLAPAPATGLCLSPSTCPGHRPVPFAQRLPRPSARAFPYGASPTWMVTVALSPDAVVQMTACRPGVGSTANGSVPTLSPAGCPSTNHQRRESAWLPAT